MTETMEITKAPRKSYRPEALKMDVNGEGTFEAVFATLNVVDKDGDITINGAFGEQSVLISQYNHGSWNDGAKALPIGVGRIFERGDEAIVVGEFDMDDPDAVKTYRKFKYISEKGLTQEFSYALPEIDYEFRDIDGRRVRVLKRIRVPEVSPVLMGAGENTRLLSVKAGKQEEEETQEEPKSRTFAEHAADVLADVEGLVKRFQEIAELRAIAGKSVSSESTDAMLKLRDRLQPVMTELDGIEKSADAERSDYLLLKNISEQFQGE